MVGGSAAIKERGLPARISEGDDLPLARGDFQIPSVRCGT